MHELIAHHRGLNRIAKLYLASQFCQALYFAWPVWYGFASQALSPLQIGIYFSVMAIVQVFAEIPTGAFADKYGRKLSAVIGVGIITAVPLVIYFGHTFPAYMLCAVLSGIGGAFISGSLPAMVYDHPNVSKEDFRRVSWLEVTFYQAGLIFSAALGGFLYSVHPSLPFIGEAAACIICAICIFFMREVRPETLATTQPESYIRYFGSGLKHLLATKYLRVVVLAGALVAVIMTSCIEFINEATMIEYGIEPSMRGLLLAGIKVVALLVINLILLKLLRSDRARLIFMAIIGTTIFALMSMQHVAIFLMAFTIFNWLSATQASFFGPILQDRLPSSHRATAMSGFSALTGFVAFGGSALFGLLIQHFGTPRAVYVLFVALFVILIAPCTFWLARHLRSENARP